MVWGWKLKGLLPPGGGPMVLSGANTGVRPVDGIGEAIDPNLDEKVAAVGDNVFGSKLMLEFMVRGPPSIPRPSSGSSGIGVGGVGVLGGAGIGRREAMAGIYRLWNGMREGFEDRGTSMRSSTQLHWRNG
jgi:hypothetical protein